MTDHRPTPAHPGRSFTAPRRIGAFNRRSDAPTDVLPAVPGAPGGASPLLARLLTVGGGIGLLAALVRASDKAGVFGARFVDPCATRSGAGCAADTLAVLNPLLGVAGFAMLTAVGAVLMTGVALTRGLWLGLQAAVTFGVVFVHGLLLRNALPKDSPLPDTTCAYCLLACAVLIPLFWYTTAHTVGRGWLPLPPALRGPVRVLIGHGPVVLITWYLLVIALVYFGAERPPPTDGAWAAVALVTAATLAGAWTAVRFSDRMGLWLSLASAMMMVTALAEILPEVREGAAAQGIPLWIPALTAIAGFAVVTWFTRQGCAHGHDEEPEGGRHRRAARAASSAAFSGIGAAAALTVHRLIEGATLALTPSAAVIGALFVHSASEGLALAALLREARRPMAPWLLVSTAGPALGLIVATVRPLPESVLPVLLALLGGVLLRTAVVGLRMAAQKKRSGELRNWQIAGALAAAGALGVFVTLSHGHEHGADEAAAHEHGADEHGADEPAGHEPETAGHEHEGEHQENEPPGHIEPSGR
jgi:zinc transporter ZupT